jgi:hypothetical protein
MAHSGCRKPHARTQPCPTDNARRKHKHRTDFVSPLDIWTAMRCQPTAAICNSMPLGWRLARPHPPTSNDTLRQGGDRGNIKRHAQTTAWETPAADSLHPKHVIAVMRECVLLLTSVRQACRRRRRHATSHRSRALHRRCVPGQVNTIRWRNRHWGTRSFNSMLSDTPTRRQSPGPARGSP